MCDCIARVDESMLSRNAKIMLPWFGPQRPFIETTKVDEKKRGKPPRLFATFCPFCGEKYPEIAQEATDGNDTQSD